MPRNFLNKKIFKIAILVLFFVIILTPVLSRAEEWKGLIPCGGAGQSPCDFDGLTKLVKNIIDWIIMIAIPISAAVFAIAGFKYMTSAVVDQKAEAKNMMRKVLIGLVFILAAWLIVGAIVKALLNPEFNSSVPIQGVTTTN